MKRQSRFPLLLVLLGTLSLSQHSSPGQERTHPRLLADSTDVARAKSWITRYSWYRMIFEENRRQIDRFIEHRPLHVSPVKQTYRYKMYTCPRHDVELTYEEFQPHEHRCPVDTLEIYKGEMYDMAWAGWYNRRLASRLLWMGLLYQVYGDDRYADAGREILLQFADLYLKYPTENTILGPAHVFFGTLSESFWGVDMAYGYDLLYNYSGFTPGDRALLRDRLFYPLARITQRFPESASNRQLWYNNVSAAVGFLYGDQELIDFALTGKYGFAWQLGSALPESGFWAEWSGYHFVALRGMIHLAEMARHNGQDLYHRMIAGRSMKKMFDAPFDVILPNYEFPRSKDSGGGNILEYAVYYEVGYAVYHDPRYAAVLNRTNISRGRQVVGEESGAREAEAPITLFMLDPEVPSVNLDIVPERSVNLKGNGFALLRSGSGNDRQELYLDYGIMGGEHGHPDRLQIGYYARGRNWIVDPLNESYFNPNLQLWYRQTIAHNTPVIDQTSQSWANGEGLFYGDNPGFQIAAGTSATIYPGTRLTRTLLQTADYFIDLCRIEGADERIIDWPLHSFGTLRLNGVSLTKEPTNPFGPPPSWPGYDQLSEVSSAKTDSAWSGLFSTSDGEHLLVLGAAGQGTRIYQALTPPLGGFYKQMVTDRNPLPMIMSRRKARSTRFAHLFHAYRETPRISAFVAEPGGNAYRVDHARGTDIISADLAAGRFSLIRSQKGEVRFVSGYGIEELKSGQHLLLRSSTRLARVECAWSSDSLRIFIPGPFVRVRVRSPRITTVILNGAASPLRRDGEFTILENPSGPVLEVMSPADSVLFQGLPQEIRVRLWNPTTAPLEGSVTVGLRPDWKERVLSEVQWWGGVTNLLPLHKNSVERTTLPLIFPERSDWIGGMSSPTATVPAGSHQTFTIRLNVPNDIPAAVYPAEIRFGSLVQKHSFTVAPPVTATLRIPNSSAPELVVCLKNRMPRPVEVSLHLRPAREWHTGASIPGKVTLGAGGEKNLRIPIRLEGYTPANQRYPIRLEMRERGFRCEIEQEFYATVAHGASIPPSLDGSWKGWTVGSPLTIDTVNQVCKLLLGNQEWKGKRDLSARVSVMYDRKYLYVGAAVDDDSVVSTWNFPAMSYPWDTDCMEVVLDTRTGGDQGTDPPTPGLFRHLSLSGYRSTVFGPDRWQGAGAGGPLLPRPLLVPGAETFFRRTGNGYALICRYPLASLGKSAGSPGGKIGFDVAINDNDGTTYRKNTHIWAGFTRNQTWWDMGTIGMLFFAPPKGDH
jgi:hypothetical protein